MLRCREHVANTMAFARISVSGKVGISDQWVFELILGAFLVPWATVWWFGRVVDCGTLLETTQIQSTGSGGGRMPVWGGTVLLYNHPAGCRI